MLNILYQELVIHKYINKEGTLSAFQVAYSSFVGTHFHISPLIYLSSIYISNTKM